MAPQSESEDDRQTRLQALTEKARVKNPRKFLQAVADGEGISVYALKQVLYRKPKAADAMANMAGALTRPISKKAKNRR